MRMVCVHNIMFVVMPLYMLLARHLVMLKVYWMIRGHLQTIQCMTDSILLRYGM